MLSLKKIKGKYNAVEQIFFTAFSYFETLKDFIFHDEKEVRWALAKYLFIWSAGGSCTFSSQDGTVTIELKHNLTLNYDMLQGKNKYLYNVIKLQTIIILNWLDIKLF